LWERKRRREDEELNYLAHIQNGWRSERERQRERERERGFSMLCSKWQCNVVLFLLYPFYLGFIWEKIK